MTPIIKRVTPLALLAATACASQPPSAAPATLSSTPVTASITPSNENLSQQQDFFTSLPVRDAAERVLTALCHKLSLSQGLNVDIQYGSPDATIHAFPHNSDYFSAVSELSTASGNKLRIDCEWIADGKTRVTLQSDLPEDRFAVVKNVVAASLQETALH